MKNFLRTIRDFFVPIPSDPASGNPKWTPSRMGVRFRTDPRYFFFGWRTAIVPALLIESVRWSVLPHLAERTVCRWRGHRWDVEAVVGPESGSEYFSCRRCGAGHRIIYY